MHTRVLQKPDGRELRLYSRTPITGDITAPSPFADALHANPHLRWHPLRGEWITYAGYRQTRTFLPPPEYNPLAVTLSDDNPTELPVGDWEVAVFDNRFPSLSLEAHDAPALIVPSQPATGKCEVVVYTQDANASLGTLPLPHIELLLEVWAERTRMLGDDPRLQYVLPFENRGAEVGVTLNHPHGQIYAYPVVPPVPARMQQQALEHYRTHGRGVLEAMISEEIADGRRLLYRGEHALAFVPACARYPFPYLMAWYQAPTDGEAHPESHLHAEFYPPYRTAEKLKYLAGTELAAGFFAMDALPEDKARELQNVQVDIDAGATGIVA